MLNVDKSIRDSLIADSLSEWIWEYDLITGDTAIISALVNFLGYSKYEIIEHIDFWFSLIHPNDVSELSNAFKKVIDGKNDYFMAEYRIKSKCQGYKWIKSNGKALKDENGKNIYLAGYHTDITSFKHIEESKQKHTTIFNNVNDIIFLSPLNPDGTSGKFIEVNSVATKLLGYSKEELLNMTPDDVYAEEEFPAEYKKFFEDTLVHIKDYTKEHCYTFETSLLKKDSTTLPVEVNTHAFKLNDKFVKLCVIRDISDRLKAEKELRKITERNKKIIELSPLGVYTYNKGIISYVNEPGLRLFGAKNINEVVGKPILDFVDSSCKELASQRISSLEQGFEVVPKEMNMLRIDGTQIICDAYSTSLSDENSIQVLSYIKDITEQKKMIEENKKLLEQTIEYDRLKTEFFSNISHELRTPLNIILSSIQLLNSIYNSSKDNYNNFTCAFEKYIGIMKQNSYRLLKLINNIIDLTRLDSGFLHMHFANNNIIETVENITLSVADYVESKGINLIFDTDTEERIIAYDDDKIERIMLNLLSNAIKYTKSGGTIEVNVKDVDSGIMIAVKDTGCGIPSDKLGVIFERFRQVDEVLTRRAEGSGIGLSLVKALVEAHEGTISAYSTCGVGSEFVISLPSKIVDNNEVYYKPLDIINNEDELHKKVERISVEFSDIYS